MKKLFLKPFGGLESFSMSSVRPRFKSLNFPGKVDLSKNGRPGSQIDVGKPSPKIDGNDEKVESKPKVNFPQLTGFFNELRQKPYHKTTKRGDSACSANLWNEKCSVSQSRRDDIRESVDEFPSR